MFTHWTGNVIDPEIANERISFSAGPRTDYFRDPASRKSVGNAPFLSAEAPLEFTLTVTVEPILGARFDAGGVFLFFDDDQWSKFAFELSDRGVPTFVSVVTKDRSDDCNGERVPGPAARMRVSRRGSAYGMYYKAGDGAWMMHRVVPVPGDRAGRIGFLVQSPTGEGTRASFSAIEWESRGIRDFRWGR